MLDDINPILSPNFPATIRGAAQSPTLLQTTICPNLPQVCGVKTTISLLPDESEPARSRIINIKHVWYFTIPHWASRRGKRSLQVGFCFQLQNVPVTAATVSSQPGFHPCFSSPSFLNTSQSRTGSRWRCLSCLVFCSSHIRSYE